MTISREDFRSRLLAFEKVSKSTQRENGPKEKNQERDGCHDDLRGDSGAVKFVAGVKV